jgi:hypothetical protein
MFIYSLFIYLFIYLLVSLVKVGVFIKDVVNFHVMNVIPLDCTVKSIRISTGRGRAQASIWFIYGFCEQFKLCAI